MPNASVARFSDRPFRRRKIVDHFLESLRLAGLPEGA